VDGLRVLVLLDWNTRVAGLVTDNGVQVWLGWFTGVAKHMYRCGWVVYWCGWASVQVSLGWCSDVAGLMYWCGWASGLV
jgi:hypothetical protein